MMQNRQKRPLKLLQSLKQLSKSFVVLMLCCLLVVGYSYKKPVKADAAATTVAVAGAVTVAAAIAALGLGVSGAMNTPAYNKACQNIWDGMSSAVQKSAIWVSGAAGQLHANLSSAFLHAVAGGMVAAYPPKSITVNFDNWTTVGHTVGVTDWALAVLLSRIQNSENVNFGVGVTNLQNLGTVVVPDVPVGATATINMFFFDATLKRIQNNSNVINICPSASSNVHGYKVDWSLTSSYYLCKAGTEYSLLSMYYKGARILGLTPTNAEKDNYFFSTFSKTLSDSDTYNPPIPTIYTPAEKSLYSNGYSVMNHKVDDVIGRIGALQGIQAGINVQLGDYAGTLAQINDAIKALTQAQVTSVDATDAAERTANDTVNKGRDTTAPKNPTMPDLKLPTGLNKKFPFCLPWDLMTCYQLFNVPAKAPVWTIPIKFDVGGIHVDHTYTFDLNSNAVLDNFLPIFKWFLNLSVLVGLIFITRKIMS
jgi:hypothetical protein